MKARADDKIKPDGKFEIMKGGKHCGKEENAGFTDTGIIKLALPNNKILGFLGWKSLAQAKLDMAGIIRFNNEKRKYNGEKVESVGYQCFLYFQECFQKPLCLIL